MTIEGLRASSWVAWLTGVFFVEFPFGIPTFKSWIQPIVFYHGFYFLLHAMVWIDHIVNLDLVFGRDQRIRLIINVIFTYLTLIFTLVIRVCMAWFAKEMTKILSTIEAKIASRRPEKPILSRLNRITLTVGLLSQVAAAGFFAGAITSRRSRHLEDLESWFAVLSTAEYWLLFFLAGTLPLASVTHIAFSFSIVITKYCVHFFEDFCDNFEQIAEHEKFKKAGLGARVGIGIPRFAFQPPTPTPAGNGSSTSPPAAERRRLPYSISSLPSILSAPLQITVATATPAPTTMTMTEKEKHLTKERYEPEDSLLQRLDFASKLFELYDEAISPLLIGLVLSIIVFLIQAVNAIIVFRMEFLFRMFNGLLLFSLIAQLVLVIFNMGHFAHKTIRARKLRLRRVLVEMPNTPEKAKLSELLDLVSHWKWKMNAWGFFVIDRSLVPGIISIMMSYVVILFQIQLTTNGSVVRGGIDAHHATGNFTV